MLNSINTGFFSCLNQSFFSCSLLLCTVHSLESGFDSFQAFLFFLPFTLFNFQDPSLSPPSRAATCLFYHTSSLLSRTFFPWPGFLSSLSLRCFTIISHFLLLCQGFFSFFSAALRATALLYYHILSTFVKQNKSVFPFVSIFPLFSFYFVLFLQNKKKIGEME